MPRRTVIEAKVVDAEKRRVPSKHYVYVIHVTWSDESLNVIYRRYSSFFDFQVKLLIKFPEEAGSKNPQQRSIPFLPGKKLIGRSHTREVAAKRQKPLNDYCRSLVRLPTHISESKDVLEFFSPTTDDINPPCEKEDGGKGDKKDIEEITGPIQSETYIVIADYKKQAKNEVTIKEGEQVEVLEKGYNGWWFISVHDSQGWAPGTFMQREDGKDEEDCAEGNSEKYISNGSYEAKQEDELSFEIGAVVEVIKKSLDGWWLVGYLKEQGWVPAAYLQVYKGPDLSDIQPSKPTQIIGSIKDLNQNDSSSADSQNMFHNRPHTSEDRGLSLDNQSKPTPPRRATVKRSLKNRRGSGAVRRRKPSVVVEYCTIADYENHVGDGISFSKGENVEVINQSDNGWWLVKINGKEGWAPGTFIEKKPVAKRDQRFSENLDSTDNNNSVILTENKPQLGGHAFQPYKQAIATPQIPERPIQLSGSRESKQLVDARTRLKPTGRSVSNESQQQTNMDSGDELAEEIKNAFTRIKSQNMYITTSCFEKVDVEGIGFAKGIEVEVLEEHSSGWWLIRNNNDEGWAPSGYLQKV